MILQWTEAAYAKINLALRVGALRPDGYHPVATVIQRLELHDRVELRVERGDGRTAGRLEVSVTADRSGVPEGAQNLAWKAAMLLAPELEAAGYGGARIEIRLEKRIPVAAGLAGGSADAAAVLDGLNRRLGLNLDPEALMAKAAALGSDVPACLVRGTMLCTGRGERVRPLAAPRLWWVLAKPGGQLSTREVYREFDALLLAKGEAGREPQQLEAELAPLVEALTRGEVEGIASRLYNDLQEAACRRHAGIAPLLARMREAGALAALVSGSGPTVAGLTADADAACRIAGELAQEGAWVWWGAGQGS